MWIVVAKVMLLISEIFSHIKCVKIYQFICEILKFTNIFSGEIIQVCLLQQKRLVSTCSIKTIINTTIRRELIILLKEMFKIMVYGVNGLI